MSLGNALALDNKSEESTARLNLTSIGRGFFSQCLLALPSPGYNGLSLQAFLAE